MLRLKSAFYLLIPVFFLNCSTEEVNPLEELENSDSDNSTKLIYSWEAPFNLTDSDTPANVVTKLQQAIDHAHTSNKKLIIEKGSYVINGQITFPSNIDIDFSGAEFKRESGTATGDIFDMFTNDDHVNGNSDISISNLTIDGNKDVDNLTPTNAAHRFSGLALSKVSNSTLKNITVNNTTNGEAQFDIQSQNPASAIFFTNNCYNINCYELNAYHNNLTGININNSQKIRIYGSITSDNGGSGIGSRNADFCEFQNITSFNNGFTPHLTALYSNVSINGENCKVNNVTTYNCTGSGLNIGHDNTEAKADFTIVDNVESYENGISGISVVGSKHILLSNINLHNNKKDNLIIKDNSSKVQVNNAIVWGYYNKNNEIIGRYGIRIESGGGHNINNATIYDNFYVGIGVLNVTGGVSIGSEVFIYNNGRADEFNAPTGNPNHKSSGIRIQNSNRCFVNGTKIFSDEPSGQISQDYGIQIIGGNQHRITYPEIWGNALNDIEVNSSGDDIKILRF